MYLVVIAGVVCESHTFTMTCEHHLLPFSSTMCSWYAAISSDSVSFILSFDSFMVNPKRIRTVLISAYVRASHTVRTRLYHGTVSTWTVTTNRTSTVHVSASVLASHTVQVRLNHGQWFMSPHPCSHSTPCGSGIITGPLIHVPASVFS